MSEREVAENAARKGRKAYYAGMTLKDNPMRASYSRMVWRDAFIAEKMEDEARTCNLERLKKEADKVRGEAVGRG